MNTYRISGYARHDNPNAGPSSFDIPAHSAADALTIAKVNHELTWNIEIECVHDTGSVMTRADWLRLRQAAQEEGNLTQMNEATRALGLR